MSEQKSESPQSSDRVVYVIPEESASSGKLSLFDLWHIIWKSKLTVLAVAAIFAIGSVAYALKATEWYRADALLVPTDDSTNTGIGSRLGGLGGLVGFAGLNIAGNDSVESIAVLKSRDLSRTFIEDRDLLTVLLSNEWDSAAGKWKTDAPAEQPDIRDAIEIFQEAVLTVSEDPQNGLVTVSIEWTDPEIAAKWVSELVALANEQMRQRALLEAEKNIAYLRGQLESTNVATLRESIGSLLETELQKLMLANGNEEFAFRVIDAAQVPKERVSPKRAVIVILATVLGGMIASFFVFVRHAIRSGSAKASDSQ